jgi:hypothetical protein
MDRWIAWHANAEAKNGPISRAPPDVSGTLVLSLRVTTECEFVSVGNDEIFKRARTLDRYNNVDKSLDLKIPM